MKIRTLLMVGGVIGLIGVAVGLVIESMSDEDDTMLFPLALGFLSMMVLFVGVGFLAGWFGREHDDVLVVAPGAGIIISVTMAIVSLVSEPVSIAAVIFGVPVAIAGAVVARAAWSIGDLVCRARNLPTASRLTAPAYVEENPDYPLWTTDAGPAIRATLDELAERVAPTGPVDARAAGIALGFPRDSPIVVLLSGQRLAIQPVDIEGAVDGEVRVLDSADIAKVSMRSVKPDGTERQISPYRDVITITATDGSVVELRLPYGTRGVGTAFGGPDVIRSWLRDRSGIAR